jgi:hypothetical protein
MPRPPDRERFYRGGIGVPSPSKNDNSRLSKTIGSSSALGAAPEGSYTKRIGFLTVWPVVNLDDERPPIDTYAPAR